MANLKGVVQLTETQYNILKTNGTITVDGTTVTFDENALYVTIDSEESSVGDYYEMRIQSNINLSSDADAQITGLRTVTSNVHNSSLTLDTTNDRIVIGGDISLIKITSIIQYYQKCDATRFGNTIKLNGGNFTGCYVGQSSDLTGTTLASNQRRALVINVVFCEVTANDVITFMAKSTGATSSAKDYVSSNETHFIVEVVK